MIDWILRDPALQLSLQLAAALLFLSAAAHKLRDFEGFRAALEAYAVLPAAAVTPAAALFVSAEAVVGVACLSPNFAPEACIAGAVLLTAYSVAIGFNLARGRRSIDCGCGGPGGRRPLSTGLVLRNAAIGFLLLLAALPSADRSLLWLDALTIAGLLSSLGLLYAALDVALANSARLRAVGTMP